MENDLHVKKNVNPPPPPETKADRTDAGSLRIALDLRRHCIQTALKQVFERHMNRYFSDPNMRKEEEPLLDVLGNVLAEWDFAALRSQGLGLEGGSPVTAFLVIPETGPPFLDISGTRIDPCTCCLTDSAPTSES